jgi:hypothetical protein
MIGKKLFVDLDATTKNFFRFDFLDVLRIRNHCYDLFENEKCMKLGMFKNKRLVQFK